MRSIISSSKRSAPPLNASTSAPRALDLGLARREGAVARLDLVRVDQALAVEAEPPPVRRPRATKPSASSRPLNTPSNAAMPAARAASTIICSDAEIGSRVASSGRRRSARRSLVPAISPPHSRAISARGEHAGGGLDHRQHRLADRFARRRCTRCAEIARGTTTKSALRSRDGVEVERMPFGADAVDADRDRHRPGARRPPRPPPRAPPPCPSGFTASSRSSTTRSAPASRALAIARGFDAGRNSTDRTANRSMPSSFSLGRRCRFRFRFAIAVASCPERGTSGKRNADDFHDRRCGPCAAVRDDGRQDRPPGLSLHDRAFRPLRPRRRARASTS